MTTNPATQEAAAMARIRSHINRSAGQRRASLTDEPLLLQRDQPGRLHRVDASQIPHDTGVALGACKLPASTACAAGAGGCTHDCDQGDACSCRPSPTTTTTTPSQRTSLLAWLAAAGVALLLLGLQALLGTPHDQ